MRYGIALLAALAVAVSIAMVFGGSAKTAPVLCDQGDYECLAAIDQPLVNSDSPDSNAGWDALTFCRRSIVTKGRGDAVESRKLTVNTKWCYKPSTGKVVSRTTSVSSSTGTFCHLNSYDGPSVVGGGIGLAMIYVNTRAHFTCQIGFWPVSVNIHPDVWINMRYGSQGAATVVSAGADAL